MLRMIAWLPSHPWPSQERILEYLRVDPRYMYKAQMRDHYYHDLAKKLYEAGAMEAYSVEQIHQIRSVGRAVSSFGGLDVMQAYYYMVQHILCGPGIWSEERPVPAGCWVSPLAGYAKMIGKHWDGVGPWKD